MATALVIDAVLATDRDWQLVAIDYQGNPVMGLLNSDTLTASVWQGADQAQLFAPTVAWIDPATATYKLSIAQAQTSALTAGKYRLQVYVTRSGRTVTMLDAWLSLTERPGSAVAGLSYVTIKDLKQYMPTIERLQSEDDRAGFAAECERATEWFNDIVLRHVRPGSYWAMNNNPIAVLVWGVRRSAIESPYFRGLIDNHQLLITPKIKECVAKRAIAMVLERQLNAKNENPYGELAWRFYLDADSIVTGTTAEFDLNNDGKGELAVDLSCTDTMQA